jgi:hypothetical protein
MTRDVGEYYIGWFATALAVGTGVALWAAIRRYCRRRAELRGERPRHCLVCGYDLRASPEICPECGMPVGGELLRTILDDAALNRHWPATPITARRPAPGERLAFVHAAPAGRQADLLTNQFRSRGVWCDVRPGPDCFLLVVAAADEERARAIIKLFELPQPQGLAAAVDTPQQRLQGSILHDDRSFERAAPAEDWAAVRPAGPPPNILRRVARLIRVMTLGA